MDEDEPERRGWDQKGGRGGGRYVAGSMVRW